MLGLACVLVRWLTLITWFWFACLCFGGLVVVFLVCCVDCLVGLCWFV